MDVNSTQIAKVSTTIKELVYKTFAVAYAFTPEVIITDSAEFGEVVAHSLTRHFTVGIKARLPYNTLMSYMKPRNWWEAVKERWAPEWFTKRYPVKRDKIELGQVIAGLVPPKYGSSYFVILGENDSLIPQTKCEEEGMGYCACCKMPTPVYVTTPEGKQLFLINGKTRILG